MNKLNLAILTATICIFAGCSTIQNYPITPIYSAENKPEVGLSHTAKIGQALASSVYGAKSPLLIFDKPFIYKGDAITVREDYPAQKVLQYGQNEKYRFFGPLEGPLAGVMYGVSKLAGRDVLLYLGKTYPIEATYTIGEGWATSSNVEFFKQEFIYNGKNGDNVKFLYREYTNNQIRGGFTQNVEYDLKDSKIVGFRNLKFEIIQVDNVEINYSIIHPFIKK
jgi:hypothetical protein